MENFKLSSLVSERPYVITRTLYHIVLIGLVQNWSQKLVQLCEHYQSLNKKHKRWHSALPITLSWSSAFFKRDKRRRGQRVPKTLTDNLLCAVVKEGFSQSFSFCLYFFSLSLSFSRGPSSIEYLRSSWCYLSWGPVRSSLQLCWPVPAVTAWRGHDKVIRRPPPPGSHSKSLLPPDFTPPCPHSLWLLTQRSPSPVIPSLSSNIRKKALYMYIHIWTCDVDIRPHPWSRVIFCRQNKDYQITMPVTAFIALF